MDEPAPSLSFVVIAFNAEEIIETCLGHLLTAIGRADWPQVEVVVVDDGSTDDTAGIVTRVAAGAGVQVRLHQQPNSGRLVARRVGTHLAEGQLVAFVDARVWMHPDAVVNLRRLMQEHPAARVWNCHIEIPRQGNRQAQFWYVLTFLGWRRYLADPRLVSFGLEDFDFYPKGTGGFICPRDLLLEAFDQLTSLYDDEHNSSDDTALIRWIAGRQRIWMSPEYAADYVSRSAPGDFVRHSFQRGTFILDSYLHPGTRLFAPLIAYFISSPLVLLAVLRKPRLLLAVPVGWLATAVGLRRAGVSGRDIVGFSLLAPAFGGVFSAGMWRGLLSLVREKRSARRGDRTRMRDTE